MSLTDELQSLHQKALADLQSLETLEKLEQWRAHYLGRRDGALTTILRSLVKLSAEERRVVGAAANQLKEQLESAHQQKERRLKEASLAQEVEARRLDITLPGRPMPQGRYHPITLMLREILGAFGSMGFQVVEGPEVELDYYNFEALNIPKGHPARDMWDTLWVDWQDEKGERPMLLRTHTSPMQVRIMEKTQPPVRVVVPGKVYRYEATDATHEWHFHQVEGLAVDEGVTFGDLKAVLFELARRIFGAERRVRFRCDYFPFVEPGCEMAIDCFICAGKGCGTCKGAGWIEVLGAGMVHPKVLEGVGYDSRKYTGYAFGLGVERFAMLKYGIDDIRYFYANDLRFLRQF
jgi:phenylalanyl-tRNA synthetase alpha chain